VGPAHGTHTRVPPVLNWWPHDGESLLAQQARRPCPSQGGCPPGAGGVRIVVTQTWCRRHAASRPRPVPEVSFRGGRCIKPSDDGNGDGDGDDNKGARGGGGPLRCRCCCRRRQGGPPCYGWPHGVYVGFIAARRFARLVWLPRANRCHFVVMVPGCLMRPWATGHRLFVIKHACAHIPPTMGSITPYIAKSLSPSLCSTCIGVPLVGPRLFKVATTTVVYNSVPNHCARQTLHS
jgi:hypothetical protein